MIGSDVVDHAISKQRRPRWTPSDDAKALLERVFVTDSFPSFAVRNQLAQQLCIDSRQVQIWFQNRRQRERLKTGSLNGGSTEVDESADSSSSTGLQEQLAPRASLLGSIDFGEPVSCPRESGTQATWNAGADIAKLSDARLATGPPECSVQIPCGEPASLARSTLSPSAGSDETSQTSVVNSTALSLHPSPLLTPSPALNTLAATGEASRAVRACGSSNLSSTVLPDAAQAARILELPGGGTVELPSGAPPALRQMFDTPGGSRALQLAARSLLRSNPILQHPGAPCHALLTGLANMQSVTAKSHDGGTNPPAVVSRLAAPQAFAAAPTAAEDAAAVRAPLCSISRSGASSEALEVLSSQFFSGVS